MKIHLLDMGQTRFGDCLVITQNNKAIMIDGGHKGDTASIRFQLSKIFKKQPPFNIDLLIVTHCHSDHIGCLPELIALGDIVPKAALLADEKMGFGLAPDDNSDSIALMSDSARSLFVAAQEEDHSNMEDGEIEQFLFDAASLVDQYKGMIKQLTANGAKIQRFPGESWSWVKAFEKKYEDFGLRILGPTAEHLAICAEMIANSVASDQLAINSDETGLDLVQQYKNIVQQMATDSNDPGIDRPGIGAAKNNQSIVVSVESGGLKALLAGDMQFAKAEVSGLGPIMNQLFKDVMARGPYNFIKLTHHTSYNGLNDPIMNEWLKNTQMFAHTGGRKDPTHPDQGALDTLKKNKAQLQLARTDRNGMITVYMKGDDIVMNKEKGRFNDFTPNLADDVQEITPEPLPATPELKPVATPPAILAPVDDGFVKIHAEIPNRTGRVTISVEIDNEKKKPDGKQLVAAETGDIRIDLPERLSGLLFITCSALLSNNIGTTNTQAILNSIRSIAGCRLVDIPPTSKAEDASRYAVNALKEKKYKGVVILGGYDVIPSRCLKIIDQDLTERLRKAGKLGFDADNFIVWSDEIYGDADGDFLAELPVSRIPDAKSAELLRTALLAPAFNIGERFGVRNLKRPFAQACYDIIPGASNLEVSERFLSNTLMPTSRQSALYYMLHGSESDGTRFWGEFKNGGYPEAIKLDNIPHNAPGSVVFTGCCWGALTVDIPAYRFARGESFRQRLDNESIALSYLKAGAVAFIGCTGSHYSPVTEPLDNYGKPMHDIFWKEMKAGLPPAQALWKAKLQYLKYMPHGLTDAIGIAAELKILRQFTCIGLGW